MPGFVSVQSGMGWVIELKWKPVARTGLSNDLNNSWSYLYEKQIKLQVEQETVMWFEPPLRPWWRSVDHSEPQPELQPIACRLVRAGGPCGGTDIGERADRAHGRTASD